MMKNKYRMTSACKGLITFFVGINLIIQIFFMSQLFPIVMIKDPDFISLFVLLTLAMTIILSFAIADIIIYLDIEAKKRKIQKHREGRV